jgi:hypothetical protein
MIKIVPLTRERIKKLNVFGADVSIGFALYGQEMEIGSSKKDSWKVVYRHLSYLYDHEELDGIITHRFILWRVKIEVKTAVEYDYSFT